MVSRSTLGAYMVTATLNMQVPAPGVPRPLESGDEPVDAQGEQSDGDPYQATLTPLIDGRSGF